MTLRHLKIFITVCDCESVTGAAKKLGMAQPAVSLAVKELETDCGARLFDRIAHKIYLTESGKAVLLYARKIMALCDEMESGLRDSSGAGLLRIGSSITIGTCLLPAYVKRFSRIYPDTKIRVNIDNSAQIEKQVQSNRLDFALIEGSTHSESLVARKFMKDRLVCVCQAGSALSKRLELRPEELPDQPMILREKGSGTRELFDSALLTVGISLTPEWESISTRAIIQAVTVGLGISVLPLQLVKRELQEKRLAVIRIRGLRLERYFYLIRHKDKHLSQPALSFCRLLFPAEAAGEKKR